MPKFEKGQSGNPGGRPKSNLLNLLAEYVKARDPKRKKDRERVLVEGAYELATESDDDIRLKAIQWIYDRLHGKAPVLAEVKADGPVPLMLIMGDEKGGEARSGEG